MKQEIATQITSISSASTATFLSSIVIFNDPVYTYLAVFSAFVGLVSALNDLDELGKLNKSFYTFFIAFKGAFIGFFVAPAFLLALVLFGDQVALKIGFESVDKSMELLSFYWILSIVFSRILAKKVFDKLDKKEESK